VRIPDPPAGRVAPGEHLRGPSRRRDSGLRLLDVGVGLALPEELGQCEVTHRGLIRFEQPIEDLVARHEALG